METIKHEKYADWVKDDLDKLICDELLEKELTFTMLKNQVFDKAIKKLSKESFKDKINRLKQSEVIKTKKVKTEFKVLTFKEETKENEDSKTL